MSQGPSFSLSQEYPGQPPAVLTPEPREPPRTAAPAWGPVPRTAQRSRLGSWALTPRPTAVFVRSSNSRLCRIPFSTCPDNRRSVSVDNITALPPCPSYPSLSLAPTKHLHPPASSSVGPRGIVSLLANAILSRRCTTLLSRITCAWSLTWSLVTNYTLKHIRQPQGSIQIPSKPPSRAKLAGAGFSTTSRQILRDAYQAIGLCLGVMLNTKKGVINKISLDGSLLSLPALFRCLALRPPRTCPGSSGAHGRNSSSG